MYKFEEIRAQYKFVLTTIQETGEKEIRKQLEKN